MNFNTTIKLPSCFIPVFQKTSIRFCKRFPTAMHSGLFVGLLLPMVVVNCYFCYLGSAWLVYFKYMVTYLHLLHAGQHCEFECNETNLHHVFEKFWNRPRNFRMDVIRRYVQRSFGEILSCNNIKKVSTKTIQYMWESYALFTKFW
jgi:hypothetical protein